MARDQRLDYAKGVAIALVLTSHLWPISFGDTPGRTLALIGAAVSGYQYSITTLGVPVFYLVACTLFFARPRLSRRLGRVAQLFAFWVAVDYAVWIAIHRSVPSLSLWTIRLGGPSLVGAQATVFFFLFDMFVLLAIAGGLQRLSPRVAVVVAWALVAVPIVTFPILQAVGVMLPLWAVVNFLPYVAIPYLASRTEAGTPGRLALGAIAFATLEVVIARGTQGSFLALPNYARTSCVLGSVALFRWIRTAPRLPWAQVTALLGRYSLGVYALHTFLLYGALILLPPVVVHTSLGVVTQSMAAVAVALPATMIGTAALARTPLRRLVT